MFAGSSPEEISPRWPQARKDLGSGGQGADGDRNGTQSQTIADFFQKNKWVRRIVYSTFRIFVPRLLPWFSVAWGLGYIFKRRLVKFRVYFCLQMYAVVTIVGILIIILILVVLIMIGCLYRTHLKRSW